MAYVFGRLGGHPSGAVYDQGIGAWTNIAGDVDWAGINVFDYERKAHLSGRASREGLDLFDHRDRSHVRLSLRSSGWCLGYDEATNAHFEVRAHGRKVEVFDLETRRFHSYLV